LINFSKSQGLYVTSDVSSDIASDIILEKSMKRTAGVPRGLLRFLVLKYLVEKPMSGAEIVEEIEKETGGKWKPSSGSIYPLLGWLQDKGFASETSIVESGMKRYSLTEEGKKFFKEQVKLGKKFLEKMEWIAPIFIGGFHFGINHENLLRAKESAKRFLETFIELDTKRDDLSKKDVEDIAKILDDSCRQLREIVEKISERKSL
jgi:DNA-binding PadR family transcriptional regulator